MRVARPLFLCALVGLSALGAAKPPFLKLFLATYAIKPESKIGKARCLNCHLPPGPPDRNMYGAEVGKAMAAANSRRLTAEILKSVEKKQASKGVTYLNRIKKDIPPGEAPAKKTAWVPGVIAICALAAIPLRRRR